MDTPSTLRQAIALAKAGDKARARQLVSEILRGDPQNADAWIVLAQIVDSPDEAVECVQRAVRIRPDDERAQRYLAYLQQQKPPDKMRISPLLIAGGIAALLLMCAIGLLASGLIPPAQRSSAQAATDAISCRELIEQALRVSDASCQTIDQGHICYGHTTVTASLAPGRTGRFEQAGDVLPIDSFTRLSAAPLDLDTQNLGIGIFKLEANLPYTVPGQLVTMVIAGNTSLEPQSSSMEVFTFSSGIGGIGCEEAPVDGLVVRMPDGAGIRLVVNGSDLALSGDALLQAQPDDRMQVTLLDGGGWISSGGVGQEFQAGESATVPLIGLKASGPPAVGPGAPGSLCILTGTCQSSQPTKAPAQAIALIETAVTQAAGSTPASTQRPGATSTSAPIDPHLPTNTSAPIDPHLPTNTPVPVLPGMPTNTSVPLPTNTPRPLPTNTPGPQPTHTPGPQTTATPVSLSGNTTPAASTQTTAPTRTPSPQPTNTPRPTATRTPAPTDTPTPVPTDTPPPPPTRTPVPEPTKAPAAASEITSLGSAAVWIGLANSDDVGISFDLQAEVYVNSKLIGSGELDSVAGGSSGFNNANEYSIPLSLTGTTAIQSGDTLSITLYARNACTGSGKNSGKARLWYGGGDAKSQFEATIDGSPTTYFLLAGAALGLDQGGARKSVDAAVAAACKPFKEFGAWAITF